MATFFINIDDESQRFRFVGSSSDTLQDALDFVATQWSLSSNQYLMPVSCHSDKVPDSIFQTNKSVYQRYFYSFGGWVRVKIITIK